MASVIFEQSPDMPPLTVVQATDAPCADVLRALAVPFQRSTYQASGRSKPVSMVAAVGLVALVGALTSIINVSAHRKLSVPPLRIVTMELQPPPPPSTILAPPKVVPDRMIPEVVAPRPVVQLPAPAQHMVTAVEAMPLVPLIAAPAPTGATSVEAAPSSPGPPAAGPVDGGDLSARMIAAPPPTYPEESRRRHEQGTVKLAVLVGVDGRVADLSLASSSGCYRLDRAALSAVRRWRWSPTMRDGEAVLVRGIVMIPFILRV